MSGLRVGNYRVRVAGTGAVVAIADGVKGQIVVLPMGAGESAKVAIEKME